MTGTARMTGMTVKMTRMTKMTWITTGRPESQQPTGSQITRICKKTVKMYVDSAPHEELCLCCFLSVSCPINAVLVSFTM